MARWLVVSLCADRLCASLSGATQALPAWLLCGLAEGRFSELFGGYQKREDSKHVKLVCISDTHGDHRQVCLPPGDVLVHAGDCTAHGSESDLVDFLDWFSGCPHPHRLFVAGNHDRFLEEQPERTRQLVQATKGVTYLNDSGITIDGMSFWGSPITPRFFDWSFMRDPGADIERHWNLIPHDTQVLITHGPPWGVLDKVQRSETVSEHTGCEALLETVQRIRPRYHLFGHIHECYGQHRDESLHYLNVSTMNKHYRIENDPVVIETGLARELIR